MAEIESVLVSDNVAVWGKDGAGGKTERLQYCLKCGILRVVGPCSLQSNEQILAILSSFPKGDVDLVRAPIFKPRTNRFDAKTGREKFSGIGNDEGVGIYKNMTDAFPEIGIAAEVMNGNQLKSIARYLSLAWVGSRTQDQYLLEDIGKAATWAQLPIMLKNAMIPDVGFDVGRLNNLIYGINEAAQELEMEPVPVIFCLRGNYPNHDSNYRNEPNWEMLQILKSAFPDLPIVIDPSHILKKENMNTQNILEVLLAAFEAGGVKPSGYMIEVYHPDYPSVTDPGVDVYELMGLLTSMN